MTDLMFKPEVDERRAEVRAFMEEHVYPNEAALAREDESSDALIEQLRAKAKAPGSGRRTCRPRPVARARASSSTRC